MSDNQQTPPEQQAAEPQAPAEPASQVPAPADSGVSTATIDSGLADGSAAPVSTEPASASTTPEASAASSPATAAESSKPAASEQVADKKPASSTKAESSAKHHDKERHDNDKHDKERRGSSTSHHSQRRSKRPKLGELDFKSAKIGFLGAGKMAESLINGLIHYARIDPKRIHVAAPSSKGLERFKALGCRVTKRNYDIFGRYDCDIIFLCFHGYVIKHCYKLGGARPHPLTTNYIPHQRHPIYILSLVSGVSLAQIKACLLNPDSVNRYVLEMHRIMMNTAVSHGLGICAVDCEPDSKKLSAPIRSMLSSVAQLEHVPASQMDAACAIGGSGLAFSYYFINALADGAFKMGLSRQQAIRFASKTASCAAQTMLESGKHPAELRDNVSSPSGAAIYGIHVLEKNDVASGVTAAVEAAHKRANDLATQDAS